MSLKPVPVSQQVEISPTIVTSAMDAAAVFTAKRLAMGMTGEAIDYHAGFQERYTAKLENPLKPWGKKGLHISPMWELLADALGLVLVIMPKRLADEIGAAKADARPVIAPVKACGA